MATATRGKKFKPTPEQERYALATRSVVGFMTYCLPHYVTLDTAPMHWELSNALMNDDAPMLEIIGFRDSAKSTMSTTAFVLLCALTKKYKFIVIINDTGEQVDMTIANIKHELENNEHIKREFGNLKVGHSKWSEKNLLLSNGVRIIGRSRGQNIRGIRHRQTRPDLVLVDDPENLKQVKTKESRDETMRWFNAEVVPAQQAFNAKLIVIGNLLHNDGFMARLSKNPLFKVLRFPIIDEKTGIPLWLAKYPTKASLALQRQKVGNVAYSREYLLKVIAEDDQVIKETDIKRYPNKLLTQKDERTGKPVLKILDAGVGSDLAISEKTTADFTTFVSLLKVKWGEKTYILVKPNPIARRMNFDATLDQAVVVKQEMPMGVQFFVEDVGFQRAALQGMSKRNISVYPMRPISDKRARLQSIAPNIKGGGQSIEILFPETGTEDLEQQIINLGVEEHDDLCDGFVYGALGLINKPTAYGGAKADAI